MPERKDRAISPRRAGLRGQAAAAVSGATGGAAGELAKKLDGLSVLVLDDNPVLLEQAEAALRRAGAEVKAAAPGEFNGSKALAQGLAASRAQLLCVTTGALSQVLRDDQAQAGGARWRLPRQARAVLSRAAGLWLLVLVDPTDPEAPAATDIWELPPRCEVQERPRDGGRLVMLVKALWQRGVTESHDGQDGKADEPDDTGATMMPELLGAERDGRATLDELEGDAEEIELDELEFSSELHLPDEPIDSAFRPLGGAAAEPGGDATAPRAMPALLREDDEDDELPDALALPAAELTGELDLPPLRRSSRPAEPASVEPAPAPAPVPASAPVPERPAPRGFREIQRQAAALLSSQKPQEHTAEVSLPPTQLDLAGSDGLATQLLPRLGESPTFEDLPRLRAAPLSSAPPPAVATSMRPSAPPAPRPKAPAQTSVLAVTAPVALPGPGKPAPTAQAKPAQPKPPVAAPRVDEPRSAPLRATDEPRPAPLRATDEPRPAALRATAEAEAVLLGELRAVPLVDVLKLLAQGQHSGVLHVDASEVQATVVLLGGRVAQATAAGLPELRLGRFLAEALPPAELERLAAQPANKDDLPLGQRLAAAGALDREDLHEALARQSAEVVYALCGLGSGRFLFAKPQSLPRTAVDPALGGGLQLDLDALLLEGFRRSANWNLGDGEGDAVYLRVDERRGQAEQLGLSASEAQVLALCSGRHGVAEIARSVRLPAPEVARILRRLQAAQLIRRRAAALAV